MGYIVELGIPGCTKEATLMRAHCLVGVSGSGSLGPALSLWLSVGRAAALTVVDVTRTSHVDLVERRVNLVLFLPLVKKSQTVY